MINSLVVLGVLTCSFALLERMVVYPLDPRQVAPADVGLPNMREREFQREGDQTVIIWTATATDGKPTIFYLHGNAGNLANRQARFRVLTGRGYGVIAPAYPGSSGSSGRPSEDLITATISDVYAATLDGQFTNMPVDPVIYGESIGAAVALQVITKTTPQPPAIILEAPFTSLRDVAQNMSSAILASSIPLMNTWNSITVAPQVDARLLVLHGENDSLIPIEHGRAIFDAASSPLKSFHEVIGAGHTDLWTVTTQKYLFNWLDGL